MWFRKICLSENLPSEKLCRKICRRKNCAGKFALEKIVVGKTCQTREKNLEGGKNLGKKFGGGNIWEPLRQTQCSKILVQSNTSAEQYQCRSILVQANTSEEKYQCRAILVQSNTSEEEYSRFELLWCIKELKIIYLAIKIDCGAKKSSSYQYYHKGMCKLSFNPKNVLGVSLLL